MQAYREVILQDKDINKVQQLIVTELHNVANELITYLKTWDEFRYIWETDKDILIRRYRGRNPDLINIDADIARCLVVNTLTAAYHCAIILHVFCVLQTSAFFNM